MTTTKTNGARAQGGSDEAPRQETLPARREEKVTHVNTGATANAESVEERIRKIQTLSDLVQQRRQLQHHLERVESMKFGEFDEKDFIELCTNSGQRYPIKSITLCKKVSDLVKYEISIRISEIEAMIQL